MEHQECPICFDLMCNQKSAVLTKDHVRCCPHFFHDRCIKDLLNSKGGRSHCPLCRQDFDGVLTVPSIESDPKGWFAVVDLNRDHRLSQKEVLEVMRAQLPVNCTILDEEFPSLFRKWDINGDGSLDANELLDPSRGLLTYIMQRYPRVQQENTPDLKSDKNAWFRYFDYDKSGTLCKDEVSRALIKTFKLSEDSQKVAQMKEVVEAVWPIFDIDGSGHIEVSEFSQPEVGLADSIIASMGSLGRR
jgi:Ca2+-binding EF-hand superfamily protein